MNGKRRLGGMTKLWFKARRYGWGWTPVTIEGWTVVVVFLVLAVAGTACFVDAIGAGADPRLAGLLFVLWNAVLRRRRNGDCLGHRREAALALGRLTRVDLALKAAGGDVILKREGRQTCPFA